MWHKYSGERVNTLCAGLLASQRTGDKHKDEAKEQHCFSSQTGDLKPLLPGEHMRVTDQQTHGTVVQHAYPRSYQISIPVPTLHSN